MERQPPPLVPHDPDLDPPPGRRVRRPPPGAILVPQEYQRLVANPFLALALLIAWLGAMRLALLARNFVAVAVVGVCFFGVIRLLHYHCLDCGHTGWLFRWRVHACEAVVARQVAGRVRRWRGPTPTVQVVLWLYVIGCAVIALGVLRLMPSF
ncbi:MAG: hypothetical protein P4L84_02635 [Isosphaeraceae bacterium]|nr:hypothetical protein [Isosphaeraceae bacterium]